MNRRPRLPDFDGAAQREAAIDKRMSAGAAALAAVLMPVHVIDDERPASLTHSLDDVRTVKT